MTKITDVDPLVGDELLEVSLHPFHVYFTFVKSKLQLGARFKILVPGSPPILFDPIDGTGDLRILWVLIGKLIKTVLWEEEINLVFASGETISIESNEGRPRGCIRGRLDMTWDDF
jgi:hypothetical protein